MSADPPDGAESAPTAPPSQGAPPAKRPDDLAKSLLARAKAEARRRGVGRRTRTGSDPIPEGRSSGPYSGPRPDDRDPQPIGGEIERLLAERGWQRSVQVASIEASWADLVGEQLAEHCKPTRFTDGELVVVAESTAWATQVRLLAPRLIGAVNTALGQGLVTSLVVHGPTSPSWRKGPLRVSDGRGPRDTYG
jgi:predicted nucleic acid-binding Zn ribbon protein